VRKVVCFHRHGDRARFGVCPFPDALQHPAQGLVGLLPSCTCVAQVAPRLDGVGSATSRTAIMPLHLC
jgi:hypothetical protein